jgi:hypothetical protein
MANQEDTYDNLPEENPFNEGKEDAAQELKYNEEENSTELDVEGEDDEYIHENPYDTAGTNGDDFDSDWDEANLEVGDEYEELSEEETVEKLGMHIDSGQIVELDPLDEKLAETPEDQRTDLDEEGYPKKDPDE